VTEVHDRAEWIGRVTIADYEGDVDPAELDELEPIRVVEAENLLMNGGVSGLWNRLISTSPTVGVFDAANAAIGAGNGTTAASATQTNLVGASRLRKGMNANHPAHTDGTATANRTITFQATFGTSEGNFDWQEVGVFNNVTDGSGRMLNRVVQAIGVKTSSVSRVVTVDITIT
jgi:hypothetical protein